MAQERNVLTFLRPGLQPGEREFRTQAEWPRVM
jgi:hypothetical protein